MSLYYSAATGGFYDTSFAQYTLPGDAVQITPTVYQQMMAGQSAGQTIKPGANGQPTLAAPPAPTAAQIAAASAQSALAAGLTITSTGTPALSGTYACTEQAQGKIAGLASGLALFGAFSAGATTVDLPRVDGTWATFTAAQFKSFAGAYLSFVQACMDVIDGHPNAAVPAGTVTIP